MIEWQADMLPLHQQELVVVRPLIDQTYQTDKETGAEKMTFAVSGAGLRYATYGPGPDSE